MATEYKLSYTASEIDEKLGKIDENTTNISKLSEDIADLKENGTGTGNGVTTAQANSLWAVLQKTAFSAQLTEAELTAFKTAWGIGGEVEPDIPDEPIEPDNPEVTLTSISATYIGGEVIVGTDLSDLTGLTVKATYSDGSTTNVTGYTLSGTIAEGSNTITVSYGGKTTTFAVTGVVESGGEDTEPFVNLFETNGIGFYRTGFSGDDITAGLLTNRPTTNKDIFLSAGTTYYAYFPCNKNAAAMDVLANNGDNTYTNTSFEKTKSYYFYNGNINDWGEEKEDTIYYIEGSDTNMLIEFIFTPTEDINARLCCSMCIADTVAGYSYLFTKEYNPYRDVLG